MAAAAAHARPAGRHKARLAGAGGNGARFAWRKWPSGAEPAAGRGVPAGEGARLRPRPWRAAAPRPRRVPARCPLSARSMTVPHMTCRRLPPPPLSSAADLFKLFITSPSSPPSVQNIPARSFPRARAGKRSVRASPLLGTAFPVVPGAGGSPRCPLHPIPSHSRRGSPPKAPLTPRHGRRPPRRRPQHRRCRGSDARRRPGQVESFIRIHMRCVSVRVRVCVWWSFS